MRSGWVLIVVLSLCVSSGYARADEKGELIETLENGCINWTVGTYQSIGVASPAEKKGNLSDEERGKVLNMSRMHALKHLLGIVLNTPVDTDSTVRDIASESDIIMAEVESLVKEAKAVKQEFMTDGTVEITLQMDMYGGFAQLILPHEIKQIESIKTVATDSGPSSDEKAQVESDTEIFSGLVIDARGTQAKPALAPLVMDEEKKEVYGSAFVSREFAVQQGMCTYTKDLDSAMTHSRVAGNPLMVKGLKTDGKMRSRIIISNADASKLRSASEHLSFLKKCRVVIVID
jgi:hypothetical protein